MWQSREQTFREAETTAERTTLILHQHAQNVFETFELATRLVEERIRSLPAHQIQGSVEVRDLLKGLTNQHPQIGAILIIDAEGKTLINSGVSSDDVNRADRDFMQAFRSGHRDIYIGETVSAQAEEAFPGSSCPEAHGRAPEPG